MAPSFTLDAVSKHNSDSDCWIVVHGKVYDVTGFLQDHPGGKKVLVRVAGQDASKQFDQFHQASVLEKYGADFLKGTLATGTAAAASATATEPGNFDDVRKDVVSILSKPGWDDGSLGPVLVRLAWHASGTYDRSSKTGGSQGATMRFKPESSDGANAGLEHARTFLEPIKKKYPWISYADLWTLAGVVAIEAMGGPKIPWKGGRSDVKPETALAQPQKVIPPNGRLPDAAQGASHIRDVFYRMGFNDQEIVALSGAHSLGRCHTDRSGFSGPWTHTPTKFSNQYYKLLLNIEWTEKKWDGPKQFADPDDELMMLPSDMALIWDPKLKPFVEVYSKDKERFYKDFSAAFSKLLELGVKRPAL